MKKIAATLLAIIFSAAAYSQVYKLENIYEEKGKEVYLSAKTDIADRKSAAEYALWGYKDYSSDLGSTYEVAYFSGPAEETHVFLRDLVAFAKKYESEDNILTFISGVKVKIVKRTLAKGILIYDKEQKVACVFKAEQLQEMLDRFMRYRSNHEAAVS